MNSNKSKASGISITFYVFSVILLLIFAFCVYNTYITVANYMEGYQMTFADEWKMFLGSYFQACVPPFVGAVVCYGIAAIITRLENTQQAFASLLDGAIVENDTTQEEIVDHEDKLEDFTEGKSE